MTLQAKDSFVFAKVRWCLDLPLPPVLGEIGRESLERLLLPHLRRRHRTARVTRCGRRPARTVTFSKSMARWSDRSRTAVDSSASSGFA